MEAETNMIGALTVKEFVQGCSEAGTDFEKYFYMNLETFEAEVTKVMPARKITLDVENGCYMKSSTRKPIWVVGHGLVKWGTKPKKIESFL